MRMYQGAVAVDKDGQWRGMVKGDVIVEIDAEAVITGMVIGRVVERGGRASVSGMVTEPGRFC